MRRKAAVAVAVFALAFAATGSVSSAQDEAPDAALAVTGQNHVAVQGTAWVAERPAKLDTWKHWAWGTRMSPKKASDQWVHIAVPTPTVLDDGTLVVERVTFCAKAFQPTKSKPVAIHLWDDKVRVHTETIAWPNTTDKACHTVTFTPEKYFSVVGVSVLVHFESQLHRVELNRAWIAMVPYTP